MCYLLNNGSNYLINNFNRNRPTQNTYNRFYITRYVLSYSNSIPHKKKKTNINLNIHLC
jgi:hypothetical protein